VKMGDQAPMACFGEIGLTGELRSVGHPDRRRAEAEKFGLGQIIAPSQQMSTLRQAVRAALGSGSVARAA
jgi:DNA repair protein RadA/Sms